MNGAFRTLRPRVSAFAATHVRQASLQELKNRVAVVESVEKITSSMKMVAAAKLKVAQAKVEPAVAFYDSTKRMFTDLEVGEIDPEDAVTDAVDADAPHLYVLVTTDRGLCGAITSNVVRRALLECKKSANHEFASIGTKGQDGLVGNHRENELGIVVSELSNKPPSFTEVGYLADTILTKNVSGITVIYNHFVNMLTNNMVVAKFLSIQELKAATKWEETEFDDEDVFQSLNEHYFASALWAAIMDNATCEQAVRMTAMDGASTNAADLNKSLTLEYNKTRQAVITTELSEIVGGMSAILDG